jgi:excinuclease UvrABC helicase subunit UvrB
MAEPVTQGQFYERMEPSDEQHLEMHRRLREAVEHLRKELTEKLEGHADEDRLVADDVLVLKTARDIEQTQTISRSTWIALLIALPSACVSAWERLHYFAGS